MLRIISANLNGIRSAVKKGFLPWAVKQKADFICMQELKAQRDDLEDAILNPDGLHAYFHHAEKKGYSGCGIYTPHKPDEVLYGYGNEEFDAEGRYVEARFKGLSVISVYMPSGSSSPERQEAKYRYLDSFLPHLIKLKKSEREIVLCGDVNIAHHEIDLKNWKGNVKNSGFLPEERAWLDERGQVTEAAQVDLMARAADQISQADVRGIDGANLRRTRTPTRASRPAAHPSTRAPRRPRYRLPGRSALRWRWQPRRTGRS